MWARVSKDASMENSKYIRDYNIIDSDGSLSNLGLHENGFSQGKFLISGEVLENLCEKHNIVVNWANK